MNEKLYAECQELVKKGCRTIIAATSCPIAAFGCADPKM
jgi:hypothetical protein